MNHHELKEGTFKFSVPACEIRGAPTRVCAVCGAYEFNSAIAYDSKSKFWLCPECLKKLKKLLDKSTES